LLQADGTFDLPRFEVDEIARLFARDPHDP
jgi:hypothetical protein